MVGEVAFAADTLVFASIECMLVVNRQPVRMATAASVVDKDTVNLRSHLGYCNRVNRLAPMES